MDLFDQISNDIKEAMKAKDKSFYSIAIIINPRYFFIMFTVWNNSLD